MSKMKGPRWQHRVRLMVLTAIAKKSPTWGRRLATFLSNQVRILEAYFGELNPESQRRRKQSATIRAVALIIKRHPDWTERQIAGTLGISTGSAHRYAQHAREHYNLPNPRSRT